MALDASADGERGAVGSLLGQLLKKPSQEQIVLLLTVALLVIFSVTLPDFSSVKNLLNLVRSISILGILGLGMGLIVISRGIDLSMVSIMAAAWSIPLNLIEAGMPIGPAILLSLFIAVLIGAVNGVIIAFVEAPPLFVTLAASFVIYGLAFWIAPSWVVYAPKNAPVLSVSGAGAALRHSDADHRLSGCGDRHASVPVEDFGRTVCLCAGRQS